MSNARRTSRASHDSREQNWINARRAAAEAATAEEKAHKAATFAAAAADAIATVAGKMPADGSGNLNATGDSVIMVDRF